ncbi:proton-conducting transporter membrane subunit [Verticiella sediminum]|uniref:proton-conducting transporter transmembrane domain-containing protein n=1 Tax=Verticiella sediminum TaxID=1247510 RepID=UPI001B85D52D|nr:proton-conducting transporter membrane subunit [Verticiella sediminum]
MTEVPPFGLPLLLATPLTPLCLALLALFARGRWAGLLHTLGPASALAVAAGLAHAVIDTGAPVRHALGGWRAPLGIELVADGVAAVMLLLTGIVAALAAWYAWLAASPDERRQARLFWPLFYLLWAGLNALFVAADLFNLYVTMELVTLAAVMLVAQAGKREALAAAMRYLLVALLGSLLYLAGVALLYGASGTLDLALAREHASTGPAAWAALALMLAGLAAKTALFPFHVWLPAAHGSAAAPVSAVLSALVIKAWFYLLVRLWLGPFAALELHTVGLLLGCAGTAAIVWGSLQAARQDRLKPLIAYSTVAQIGYLFLFFPLFSQTPSLAWSGTFYLALTHGLAKAAFFLAAGNVLLALGTDRIDALARLAGRLKMSLLAMGLAGVSLMGLPPAGGFVGKWLLLEAGWRHGAWLWIVVLAGGGLLSALYVIKVLGAALARAPEDAEARAPHPVPWPLEWLALVPATLAFLLGVAAALPLNLLDIGVALAQAAAPRTDTSSGAWLLTAILLSSFFPGLAVFFLTEAQSRLRIALNLAGAVAKVVLVLVLLDGVMAGNAYEARIAFLPGLDLSLRADPLSLQFVTLSAGLWLATTIYAIGYLKRYEDRSRFFGFFSLSVTASTGIALSGNLVTFLYFYEFLTIATYPLVVHSGTPQALAAGRRYLVYTLIGGVAVLLGTLGLHVLDANLEFSAANSLEPLHARAPGALALIFALLMGGMGVKAALVPLHGWLPSAMVAPAPVSALLHAVAVVKAGVFGIIRVLYDVFGLGFSQAYAGTAALAAVAAFTIVYGSVRALFQREIKKRLAYSTVSQLSYIALGACLASPIATIGALVHIVHQGLMKITLFFCAGNLAEARGVHTVDEMRGMGRAMPWTMAAFTVGAFGMIGLPPVAGFVSKWYLAGGALDAGQGWVIWIFVASTVLNAAYFLPMLYAAWFLEPAPARGPARKPLTMWMLLPPVATALASIGAGVFAGLALSPLGWAEVIAERDYYGISPEP